MPCIYIDYTDMFTNTPWTHFRSEKWYVINAPFKIPLFTSLSWTPAAGRPVHVQTPALLGRGLGKSAFCLAYIRKLWHLNAHLNTHYSLIALYVVQCLPPPAFNWRNIYGSASGWNSAVPCKNKPCLKKDRSVIKYVCTHWCCIHVVLFAVHAHH